MTSHTTTLDLDLSIGCNECSWKVECSYEYHRAEGDGWHSPRIPECVSLESAEVTVNGQARDVLWLLSPECVRKVEADLLAEVHYLMELASEDAAASRVEVA